MPPQEKPDRLPVPADAVPTQTRRRVARSPGDRIARQVEAIDSWNAARRMRESLLESTCVSQYDREGARRQIDVLRRTQQAIVTRTAAELAQQPCPLALCAPTVVIAHRHPWFAEKVAALLEARGVTVVACTTNGADALGAIVAEQPDVLLTGDQLVMMPGSTLLAEARLFAPTSLQAVQVSDPYQQEAWLTHVDAVFLRHQPPGDVADALGALCLAPVAEHSSV